MRRQDPLVPVSMEQFLLRQPDFRREHSVEKYYLDLTNYLIETVRERNLLEKWPSKVVLHALLGVTGYFQDILVDGGIWRSFIYMNRKLYDRPLPFFKVNENYIDYELNKEDIRFILWYSLAMNYENKRISNPLAEDISVAADIIWNILEARYESAPAPECWTVARHLDIKDPNEAKQIYSFSNWLFIFSYLMSPAYSLTLHEIMQKPEMQTADITSIEDRIEQSMMEDPTGPLALYLREWLFLIVEGKLPKNMPEEEEINDDHPYWKVFKDYTKGDRIIFFGSYKELNNFFIDYLGWKQGEDHLPQLKGGRDFVLLVDRKKGMLLAKDICRCIKYPSNPYYDKEYARNNAMSLLTERGRCPADLLHFINAHHALPDAHFENSEDNKVVADNFDFIARCYLQLYYRGD